MLIEGWKGVKNFKVGVFRSENFVSVGLQETNNFSMPNTHLHVMRDCAHDYVRDIR